jgi:hypothetical protein
MSGVGEQKNVTMSSVCPGHFLRTLFCMLNRERERIHFVDVIFRGRVSICSNCNKGLMT